MLGVLGHIDPPIAGYTLLEDGGLTQFISRIIIFFYILAGLYVLINLITAGYLYLSGSSQGVSAAWERIWQSFVGLLIIGAALLLTSLISWIIFGDPSFILSPTIPTP